MTSATNKTAICLLLDRSGSMYAIKDDAEGGIKSFIEAQRLIPGVCTLRVCQFNNEYSVVYPSTPIADAAFPSIDPMGSTALLDAWGQAMTEFRAELAAMGDSDKPGHIIFVVVTDGRENSSREWNRTMVRGLVDALTAEGWKFVYLGANQDAVAEAATLGVSSRSSMTYAATGDGMTATYDSLAKYVTTTRTSGDASFTEAERTTVMPRLDRP